MRSRADSGDIRIHPILENSGVVQALYRVLLVGHMLQKPTRFQIEFPEFPGQIQYNLIGTDLVDGVTIRLARVSISVRENVREGFQLGEIRGRSQSVVFQVQPLFRVLLT